MRVSRLFSTAQLIQDSDLVLDGRNSHYLKNVLRLREGAALILFDGTGGEFEAQISKVGKRELTISVGKFIDCDRESSLHTHLGLAISRGERMDWALQKATELGVSTITPILSRRSEFKLKGDKLQKRLDHWRGVCVAACEQSGRTRLPQLHEPQTLADWSSSLDCELKLTLDPLAESGLKTEHTVQSAALAVGAEGGLSEEEIKQLRDAGFQGITLGPRILRTETAPLTVLSLLQFHWGDLV